MFKPNTLFVLGAAASLDFGLPTGEGLKEKIAEKLYFRFEHGTSLSSGDRVILAAIDYHCSAAQERVADYLEACRRVALAMPQSLSIDTFLDSHPDDKRINLVGKLAISRCILEAERSSILFSEIPSPIKPAYTYAHTWLSPFCKRLTEGLKKDSVDKAFDDLSFINFNYDRCLETALFSVLQNSYFLTDGEASNIIGKSRIFHPYGSLGRLPWQLQSSSAHTAPYGNQVSPQELLTIAGGIKTFTEQVNDADLLQQIRSVYSSASKIIFLGFGFHDINMRLMSANAPNVNYAYGTVYGLSPDEQILISQVVSKSFQSTTCKINLVPIKCIELLLDYGRSICTI